MGATAPDERRNLVIKLHWRLCLVGAGLSHRAMLLGEDARRSYAGHRYQHLILPTFHHVTVAAHHCIKPDRSYIFRIRFCSLAYLGIEHVSALEHIRVGGTWHEAGHRDPGVLQLVSECKGEGIDEKVYVKNCSNPLYNLAEGKQVIGIHPRYFRPAEVELLIGDATKANTKLGWKPTYDLPMLVKEMMEEELKYQAKKG